MYRTLWLLVCVGIAVGAALPASAAAGGSGGDLAVARSLALPGVAAAEPSVGASAVAQRYPYLFPRASEDRPDEQTGRQIHVAYLVPTDFPDERLDELGVLEDSIRSSNAWMRQQTGGRGFRFDTYAFEWDDPATAAADPVAVSAIDVTFVRSSKASDGVNAVGEVEAELAAAGLDDPNKRYFAYVASSAGGVCGDAWFPIVGDGDGQYSTVYLNSAAGCRAKEFAPNASTPSFTETIVIQEIVHNDGMVPVGAPRGCGPVGLPFGHVCVAPLAVAAPQLDPEWTDVMYPFVGLPLAQKRLDADRLDYFGHPYPIRDLDTSVYLTPAR